MEPFFYEGKVMWAQIDANMHLRHSAYADFGAQSRLELLAHLGFTSEKFDELKIGPVLFREETIYLREVRANDSLRVSCVMTRSRKDGSRWGFRHELFRSDGVKAAEINVYGAWINSMKRKLTPLPPEWADKLNEVPKSHDFVEEPLPPKKESVISNPNLMNMTALDEQFENAKKRVMELPEKPSNEVMLELYALNKQATLGDLNIEKPAMFDFVAAAKYNAWNTLKGLSPEAAKEKYVNLVNSLF
jgi:acyl-CoA thioester hydrolase